MAKMMFRTSDGYLLWFVPEEGRWVDSLDPETRDMAFDNDPIHQMPRSSLMSLLDGRLFVSFAQRVGEKLVKFILVSEGIDMTEKVFDDDAGREYLQRRYGIDPKHFG